MLAVCPGCNTINRLPSDRPLEPARCGHCHRALFPGQPLELDGAQLQRQIARSDLPVLVDCWADWCGPCHQMAPVFAQAATRLNGRAVLAKLDTEANAEFTSQLGIRSLPTIILFRGGREQARVAGAMDLASLLRWTEVGMRGVSATPRG